MQITEVFMILIFTLGADSCIPIGGMIAKFEHIQPLYLEKPVWKLKIFPPTIKLRTESFMTDFNVLHNIKPYRWI